MPRAGNTTERGYGHQHQQRRARLLAALVDGTLCPYCGEPMHSTDELDADHSVPLVHGGQAADRLAHRKCNREAGSALAHAPRCAFHSDCGSIHSRAW
jgi:5-methylcytosine-specific restriction endonuclease McrA